MKIRSFAWGKDPEGALDADPTVLLSEATVLMYAGTVSEKLPPHWVSKNMSRMQIC